MVGLLVILIVVVGAVVVYAVMANSGEEDSGNRTTRAPRSESAVDTTSNLTLDALSNAVYPSGITLVDGSFERGAYNDPNSNYLTAHLYDVMAFGDLDGDGADDAAVFLIMNWGGSAVGLQLVAVLNHGGTALPVGEGVPLGDRIGIESVAIVGGRIELDMIVHGPNDPLCCPTRPVSEVYVLSDGGLSQKP